MSNVALKSRRDLTDGKQIPQKELWMSDDEDYKDNVVPFPVKSSSEPEPQQTSAPRIPMIAMSLRAFHEAVDKPDIKLAASILASVFNLDSKTSEKAAEHYRAALAKDGQFHLNLRKMYEMSQGSQTNQALMKIYECLGIQGPMAIQVLSGLKKTQTGG